MVTRTYQMVWAGSHDVTLQVGIAGDEEVVADWVEEFIEINKPAITDLASDIESAKTRIDKLEEQVKLYYSDVLGEPLYAGTKL